MIDKNKLIDVMRHAMIKTGATTDNLGFTGLHDKMAAAALQALCKELPEIKFTYKSNMHIVTETNSKKAISIYNALKEIGK